MGSTVSSGGGRRNARIRPAPQLNFEVTAETIQTSIARDSSHCMIADALQQAMPNASYITVDLATIRFSDTTAGWRYIYLTPRAAQEALIRFDQGEPVEPFAVQQRACQMVVTGTAKRARRNPPDPDNPDCGSSGSEGWAKRPRKHVVGANNGGKGIIVGGEPPPLGPGPVAGPSKHRDGHPGQLGKRREFGMRAFVR